MRQQLVKDAASSSQIPADPLVQRDPLAQIFQLVDKLADRLAQSEPEIRCNVYVSESVRDHNARRCQAQPVERTLDFTGASRLRQGSAEYFAPSGFPSTQCFRVPNLA